MNYITSFRVDQVTVVIDRFTITIEASFAASFLIRGHDNVTFLVAAQVAEDVDLIEVAPLMVLIRVLDVGDIESARLIRRIHDAESMGARHR